MRFVPAAVALAVTMLSACAAGPTDSGLAPNWAHAATGCASDNPNERIRLCTAMIETGTESADNIAIEFYNRGTGYREKGDRTKAYDDFSTAIKINPIMVPAYRQRGNILLLEDKPSFAIGDFTRALTLDPNGDWARNGNIFAMRGLAEAQLHDYDSAIRDFDQSIRVNPRNGKTFYSRGFVYGQAHKLDLAIEDFSHALALDPSIKSAFYERGAAYIRSKQYSLAAIDLSREIAATPNWAYAWNERCRARTLAGDFPGALDDCRQALSIDSMNSLSFNAQGFAYLRQGDLPAAINNYTVSLMFDAKSPSALYGKGMAEHLEGLENLAAPNISAATALDPDIAEEFASYGLSATEADLPFAVHTGTAAPDY